MTTHTQTDQVVVRDLPTRNGRARAEVEGWYDGQYSAHESGGYVLRGGVQVLQHWRDEGVPLTWVPRPGRTLASMLAEHYRRTTGDDAVLVAAD